MEPTGDDVRLPEHPVTIGVEFRDSHHSFVSTKNGGSRLGAAIFVASLHVRCGLDSRGFHHVFEAIIDGRRYGGQCSSEEGGGLQTDFPVGFTK